MPMKPIIMNPTMPITAISLAILLVTGCAGGMKTDEAAEPAPGALEAAQEQIERVREVHLAGNRNLDRLDELEEIRVPAAEAWLDRPLRAHYRELCAHNAIRALVQDRPVRFELDPAEQGAIPMVRRLKSARTVRGHLDSIAEQANWSWSLNNGVLRIRDIETRRFALSSQPGSYSAGLGLRNLNESGGAVADNKLNLALDPYAEEIEAHVRDLLGLGAGGAGSASAPSPVPDEAVGVDGFTGQTGGPVCTYRPPFHTGAPDYRTSVRVSPSANLLTVTARPNQMREVEALLADFDGAVSRIIRIQLSLIEVDFRDGKKRDLALSLIRRSSELPLHLLLGSSSASVLSGDDSIGIFGGTIRNEGGAAIAGTYTEEGEREAGSSAVAQWLDTLGDASITYDDTVEVLNNRITSVDLTRTRQYISKLIREVEGDELSTEVEFEDLRTGLVVHLQPTARADGRITLTLGFSRSALVGTNPYNFGTVQGETHETDDFNRLLSISLKDGETRLLASLSDSETREESSRIPFFGRFGLGTSRNQSSRNREIVMMITATVIDA